ncbi:helix-turn-helix transcriptional regulator [Methylobacterium sp. E-045]|uniref:helix-turn-helix transcriptional regulator n=1 Tax=Methylobacterium sp. E-045 TaxID=2836575 RepID=UPI001FBA976D|nr:helix-turn-helix transcriptional regulator [Methylobacterium sp. E-045]MCJ2132213.1 helix-turn-helix domain-containing protein [Methylobacterium sp. E-045]
MSKTAPNRIAEFRKAEGLTQQELAEAVGAHWITISRLERGKLPLSFDWAERIGNALKIGKFAVYNTEPEQKRIFVDGSITSRGEVEYYLDEAGNEIFNGYLVNIDFYRRAGVQWFEIESDGFFPFFQTNDLVQVTWQKPEDIDIFINRLCIASIKMDSKDYTRNILGFVVPGRKNGTYDVNILSGAPLRNVILDTVAVVTMALFNPSAWKSVEAEDRSDSEGSNGT